MFKLIIHQTDQTRNNEAEVNQNFTSECNGVGMFFSTRVSKGSRKLKTSFTEALRQQ